MKSKQKKYSTRAIMLQKIYTLGYEDEISEKIADQGAICKISIEKSELDLRKGEMQLQWER